MLQLPKEEISYWKKDSKKSKYPPLRKDVSVDVAIVGGGITGLTTAYLLKQSGLTVAVLEKDTIGHGTTGHTTGKVTSQHNIFYHEFKKRMGEKTARIYGQANEAALIHIDKIIRKEKIECSWRREDNYVYTDDVKQIQRFKAEAKTAAEIGLPATFETTTSLPFTIKAAVRFSHQASFHSQRYIEGLASVVQGKGSHIFEKSRAFLMQEGTPGFVRGRHATIHAKDIVVATNVPTFPLLARGAYCILEYPYTSYIVAGYIKHSLTGMYISPDKHNYSLLPIHTKKGQLLLVGGEQHIPGVRLSVDARYQKLANYAEEKFGMAEISYRWSARDYVAYDDIPLIGKLYPWSKHMYVATAFKKWGLAHSMVAAMILTDMIHKEKNPWADVYTSQRITPITSIPRVIASFL